MKRPLIALLCLAALSACTKKSEKPVPAITLEELSPMESPAAVEVATPPKTPLAQLLDFGQRVTFRRQAELSWEEAVKDLPLFRFDAVRTHERATARIEFVNGSVVNMSPDSLLIINPSNSAEAPAFDRVLMRKGNLKAETKKELWILTTAALFRIKPRDKAIARGNISVQEGKKLRVEINEGEGLILRTERPGQMQNAKPVKLAINKPVVIAAPTMKADFDSAQIHWIEPAQIEEKARQVASVPAPSKPKIPTLSDFVITSPPDYAEIKDSVVELKGRVTGDESSISVNGKTVPLGKKKDFRAKVQLSRGANAIVIQLNRAEGGPVFRRWTVIRRE